MYQKVVDAKHLYRDADSKAIVNRDQESLNKYREERDLRSKLVKVAREHDDIKKEVAEIKTMLQAILERVS